MKKILVSFNLFLVALIGIIVVGNLSEKEDAGKNPAPQAAVKKSEAQTKNKTEETPPVELCTPAEAVNKIIVQDVFNQIRSPLANTRMGRSEMTLLGVIENKAAIIKNNSRQQQFNPFLAQAMRMSASMSGHQPGRFTQWSQVSGNRRNVPVQQYVRLGETMSTGYTLTEVTRQRAVLVRGNDKVELELQDPSKNRSVVRQRAPRLNATQQFQQAQMFMQSQMIQTMREIQQNSRSGAQGNRNRR
jgi:hypothetical protein